MSEYLLTILVAYDDNFEKFFQDLKSLITNKYPKVELLGYNTGFLKERKKAFGIKGSYAAKLNPFAVICDKEGKPLKAFYSEVNECTIDNIIKFIDSIVNI